jgi:RimJ/RimL family protein N-acetyltransferase
MEWVIETDLATYGQRVLPWLERDPVHNSVAATVLMTRLDGTVEPVDVWTAWLAGPDGEVAGVALRTPPRGMLVTALPADAAATLAAIATDGIGAAAGPQPSAGDFCRAYAARTGARAVLERTEQLYRLDVLEQPPPVPGRLRPMAADEVDLLVRWLTEFSAESHAAFETGADVAARSIAQGRRVVWEVDGEPVCLVGFNPPVGRVPRIGPVWTPPEHRRRGYAAAATAATCRLLLDGGAVAVALFADDANPTAVGVYTRLGFRPVTAQEDWLLEY